MATFLLIRHGGPSKIATIRATRELGDVVVVDVEPPPCDVPHLPVRELRADAIVDAVRAANIVPTAVLTFVDPVLELTVAVASALEVPHLDVDAIRAIKNKHEMRRVLLAAGHREPRFAMVDDDSVDEAGMTVGFPLVLKPATGGAYGLGVARADSPDELRRAFVAGQRQMSASTFSGLLSGVETSWMVEGFLDGIEVSVELLGRPEGGEVVAVHEKVITEHGGAFREDRFVTAPYRLSADEVEIARTAAIEAARALRFERGVAHVEMRITDRGAFVIELQAVPGGAMISQLCEWSTGVNLHQLHARAHLGVAIPRLELPPAPLHCAMDVLYADRPGTYDLVGLDVALRHSGVLAAEAPRQRGIVVKQPASEYLGFLVTRAETAEEALELSAEMRRVVRLVPCRRRA